MQCPLTPSLSVCGGLLKRISHVDELGLKMAYPLPILSVSLFFLSNTILFNFLKTSIVYFGFLLKGKTIASFHLMIKLLDSCCWAVSISISASFLSAIRILWASATIIHWTVLFEATGCALTIKALKEKNVISWLYLSTSSIWHSLFLFPSVSPLSPFSPCTSRCILGESQMGWGCWPYYRRKQRVRGWVGGSSIFRTTQ